MHLRSLTRSKLARAGVVLGVAAAAVLTTATSASAAVALTISPATGPANSANGPTVTVNTTTAVFSGTPTVSFQLAGTAAPASPQTVAQPPSALNACWPTYPTGVTPTTATAAGIVNSANVQVFSPTKLYVKVPSLPIIGTPPTKYHVCVYSGTDAWVSNANPGSLLLANLNNGYSVSAAATITSVSPNSGPARGGTPIVVTGTGLNGATVLLGGVAMTPTIASDGLSFTAVTPPHAADGQPVALSVTTAGGTVTRQNAFTYSNGITVAPSTMPKTLAGTGRTIEVTGVGFSSLNPQNTAGGTTPDTLGAHVFLSRGAYSSATVAGHKANPQVSECADVLILNDGLLICKIGMVPYSRTTSDATVTGTTLESPTANFTSADIGLAVTAGTATGGAPGVLAANTVISSVTSPTTAVLNNAATVDGLLVNANLASSRTIASAPTATSGGVTTLTAANGTGLFTSADVGRMVNNTGVYITSITDTDTAILSGPLATDLSAANAVLKNVLPDGAYTVTVVNDGRLNAVANNPNYNQSVISSGSTFTVGDYVTTS